MRLSRFFLPTSRDIPAEAQIVSHRLMLRSGMIRQNGAGIYTWLPLGLRALRKIEQIVRQEQNRAGAIEMLMPTIQPASLWRESGRYDAYGQEMLRIKDRSGRDMLYGPTNEEMITDAFRNHVRSYRQVPLILYHVQWKFRDEVRPRFGIMRGREFLMKDAYSFDLDKDSAVNSYHKMYCAYLNTFARLGLKAVPTRAETGPIGGDLSHEFIILAKTGESLLHCDKDLINMPPPGPDLDFDSDLSNHVQPRSRLYSATDDMHDQTQFEQNVPSGRRLSARGIEVGHIFYFGSKYSQSMKALISDASGTQIPVEMGSYGIGVSRLVGAMIEASHDEKGMIWPVSCAPFTTGIVNLKPGDADVDAACEAAYAELRRKNGDPLYDDSSERPGHKLSVMELIGIPHVLVIGPRGLKQGLVEWRTRATGSVQQMSLDTALTHMIKAVRS